MPRNNDLFQYLDSITKYVLVTPTPGDTTTTEAIVGYTLGSEVAVDVVGITNFTTADPAFIISSGGMNSSRLAHQPPRCRLLGRCWSRRRQVLVSSKPSQFRWAASDRKARHGRRRPR
jgi:hypothetical protein